MFEKKCQGCGKKYLVRYQTRNVRRYCSDNCAKKYGKQIKGTHRNFYNLICQECGKKYIVHTKLKSQKKYCSQTCYFNNRRRENLVKIKCEFCGLIFQGPKQTIGTKRFCSRFCANKARRKKLNNYNQIKTKEGFVSYKHREVMSKKLGRKLKSYEIIHHIDMDKNNNKIGNLYLFSETKEHTQCHWSINKLIKNLLKRKIIVFNKGIYKIKGT